MLAESCLRWCCIYAEMVVVSGGDVHHVDISVKKAKAGVWTDEVRIAKALRQVCGPHR